MDSKRDISLVIDEVVKILPVKFKKENPKLVTELADLKNGRSVRYIPPESKERVAWRTLGNIIHLFCSPFEGEVWLENIKH